MARFDLRVGLGPAMDDDRADPSGEARRRIVLVVGLSDRERVERARHVVAGCARARWMRRRPVDEEQLVAATVHRDDLAHAVDRAELALHLEPARGRVRDQDLAEVGLRIAGRRMRRTAHGDDGDTEVVEAEIELRGRGDRERTLAAAEDDASLARPVAERGRRPARSRSHRRSHRAPPASAASGVRITGPGSPARSAAARSGTGPRSTRSSCTCPTPSPRPARSA